MVVGPAWTRGEIEKPAGERNMGSWTEMYYTPEQQTRLGVDEHGERVAAAPVPEPAEAVPNPEPKEVTEAVMIHARRMGGQDTEIQISLSCSVAELKAKVSAMLELPASQVQLTFGDTLLDRDAGILHEFGIKPESEINVVVLNKVTVTRHVYNARGGAPPYRGSYLTSTDTVELDPGTLLSEQWNILVPPDGFSEPPFGGEVGSPPVLLHACGTPPPKKWESDDPKIVDKLKTAAEVFGSGDQEVVILIPMRGMD